MNLQIHGERCSRCTKSWRSGFARFFLFSFLLLFFLFLSTINRPFDFHGNERFPSKYRIDRRPTKRENRYFRGEQWERLLWPQTEPFACRHFVLLRVRLPPPPWNFHRIPDDRFSPHNTPRPRATAMVTASNLPVGSPFIVGDGIRF